MRSSCTLEDKIVHDWIGETPFLLRCVGSRQFKLSALLQQHQELPTMRVPSLVPAFAFLVAF